MKKYLLLTPIDMGPFESLEELSEALDEFGCSFVTTQGWVSSHRYITCNSLEALAQMSFNLELPGHIVEYTAIYDSKEETTTTELE